MEINRNSINIGGVFTCDIFSLRSVRKIIFYHDLEKHEGVDLVNKTISYPFSHNNSRSTFFINQSFNVSTILENLGYPEILDDNDIEKLLNIDFSKVFIESGIYSSLQNVMGDDNLNINCYKNNLEVAKSELRVLDEELAKKLTKKRIFKRGK